MNLQQVRQVDTERSYGAKGAALVSGHVALATGFLAWELGLDPIRAAAVDFTRFSDRNRFQSLASDARAMAFYLTATAQDIPVTELARLTGYEKQQVSRWVQRVEDMRDNRHSRLILERAEKILGVVS